MFKKSGTDFVPERINRGDCRAPATNMSWSGIKPGSPALKVPKREIFDRSDFPDFYTIKSLRVGDFGVKTKKFYKIFRGSFRGAKFLMRMLSVFLRRFFFYVLAKKFFFLWRF